MASFLELSSLIYCPCVVEYPRPSENKFHKLYFCNVRWKQEENLVASLNKLNVPSLVCHKEISTNTRYNIMLYDIINK
jgi:hypothetical protein